MTGPDTLPPRSRLVRERLADAGIDVRIVVLPESAHTAALAAQAIGCPVGAIANSLVLVADGEPILVMTSGAHRVDLTVLADQIAAESVRMASPSIVRSSTGQVIGGVAPVGHPAPLRTYIDESLSAFDEVWTAGGTAETVLPLRFAQLAEVTGGTIVPVR